MAKFPYEKSSNGSLPAYHEAVHLNILDMAPTFDTEIRPAYIYLEKRTTNNDKQR